jgi:hypothetical protein
MDGLQKRYGPVLARLYREVIEYRPRVPLDDDQLRHYVELDSAPVLYDIVANKVSGGTLRAFPSLMIGNALLENKDAVVRWATEGLQHSQHGTGDWPATKPQWQAVLDAPDEFIQIARQIKYLLNQI